MDSRINQEKYLCTVNFTIMLVLKMQIYLSTIGILRRNRNIKQILHLTVDWFYTGENIRGRQKTAPSWTKLYKNTWSRKKERKSGITFSTIKEKAQSVCKDFKQKLQILQKWHIYGYGWLVWWFQTSLRFPEFSAVKWGCNCRWEKKLKEFPAETQNLTGEECYTLDNIFSCDDMCVW